MGLLSQWVSSARSRVSSGVSRARTTTRRASTRARQTVSRARTQARRAATRTKASVRAARKTVRRGIDIDRSKLAGKRGVVRARPKITGRTVIKSALERSKLTARGVLQEKVTGVREASAKMKSLIAESKKHRPTMVGGLGVGVTEVALARERPALQTTTKKGYWKGKQTFAEQRKEIGLVKAIGERQKAFGATYIPSLKEIGQAGARFREAHPTTGKAIYRSGVAAAKIAKRVIPEPVGKALGEELVSGTFGYKKLRAKPLTYGADIGGLVATGAAFGAGSKVGVHVARTGLAKVAVSTAGKGKALGLVSKTAQFGVRRAEPIFAAGMIGLTAQELRKGIGDTSRIREDEYKEYAENVERANIATERYEAKYGGELSQVQYSNAQTEYAKLEKTRMSLEEQRIKLDRPLTEQEKYSNVFRMGSEIIPMVAGGAYGWRAGGRVISRVQTAGKTAIPTESFIKPEVLSGKEQFPTTKKGETARGLMEAAYSKKYGLPSETTRAARITHATPEQFAAETVVRGKVTRGTDVPVLYGTPAEYGASVHFLRVGSYAKTKGLPTQILSKLKGDAPFKTKLKRAKATLFKSGLFESEPLRPAFTRITLSEGVARLPKGKGRGGLSELKGAREYLTKEAKFGQAHPTPAVETRLRAGIRGEVELGLTPGTKLVRTGTKYKVDVLGKKIPIDEFTALAEGTRPRTVGKVFTAEQIAIKGSLSSARPYISKGAVSGIYVTPTDGYAPTTRPKKQKYKTISEASREARDIFAGTYETYSVRKSTRRGRTAYKSVVSRKKVSTTIDATRYDTEQYVPDRYKIDVYDRRQPPTIREYGYYAIDRPTTPRTTLYQTPPPTIPYRPTKIQIRAGVPGMKAEKRGKKKRYQEFRKNPIASLFGDVAPKMNNKHTKMPELITFGNTRVKK